MTPFATISTRYLTVALLLIAFAPGLAAQSTDALNAQVFDPLTGEPVPLGLTAPPTETPRGGGDELTPRQYLPQGSTKLVRSIPKSGANMFYQDGAALVPVALDTVADPNDCPCVGELFLLKAQPADATVAGDLVYVALRKDQGLLILEPDFDELREIGQVEGRDLLAIAVSGDYAYAGVGTSGIVVYDVSDPSAPTEVSAQDTPGSANGAWVDGATLYIATGIDGLRVYDLTNPETPSEIGSFGTGGEFATYVAVRDDTAYLTGNFGLIVLDVSDPANPTELGRFDTGGETTYEIAFDDNTAYLPGLDGLRALDISDSANITEEAFFEANQALSVDIQSGSVLLAERFQGLHVLTDLGDEFEETTFLENAGFSHKPFFDGDLLYVTDLAGGLRIIDTSGETAAEIARIDVPPNTQEVVVSDGLAYVTDADFGGTGLTILDVSDPAEPEIVGSYGSGNQVFGLDVVGTTVYLANGFSGLVVLDASDPAKVVELGSFPIGSNAVDVAVRDEVAYLVSFGGGMLTLDVTDPANIAQLDAEPSFGFLNAIDLEELEESEAFVADGQQGLRIVDILPPSDIMSVGTAPTASQARDVAAAVGFGGDVFIPLAYVADDFYGIREFETFSSGAFESGSFESSDRGIGVAAQPLEFDGAPLVALAAGETGVYFFEAPYFVSSEPGTSDEVFLLAAPFPNPVRGTTTLRYTLPASADVMLAVYDVLGRRVATLADGPQAAGTHEASFGADTLPSGVYLVRLTAGVYHTSQRLTVLR